MALFVHHFANYDKTLLDLSKQKDYRLLDVLKCIQYTYIYVFYTSSILFQLPLESEFWMVAQLNKLCHAFSYQRNGKKKRKEKKKKERQITSVNIDPQVSSQYHTIDKVILE